MMNSRKPAVIMPITDNTRAIASCGGPPRLHNATASDQQPSSSTHSSNEFSCAPQVAAMR